MKANVQAKENYIPVITKKGAARVNISEILYIETQLRVVHIHTPSRVYRFYEKLDEVAKYLKGNFYRCHKSCIVNFDNIMRMEDGVFYFRGGVTLQVGQNNYRHTKNFYMKYLTENAKTDKD